MKWIKRLFKGVDGFPEPPEPRPAPKRPEVIYPYYVNGSRDVEDFYTKTKKRKSGKWEYRVSVIKWSLCEGLTVTGKRRFGRGDVWIIANIDYDYLIQGIKTPIPKLLGRDLDDVLKEFGGEG